MLRILVYSVVSSSKCGIKWAYKVRPFFLLEISEKKVLRFYLHWNAFHANCSLFGITMHTWYLPRGFFSHFCTKSRMLRKVDKICNCLLFLAFSWLVAWHDRTDWQPWCQLHGMGKLWYKCCHYISLGIIIRFWFVFFSHYFLFCIY